MSERMKVLLQWLFRVVGAVLLVVCVACSGESVYGPAPLMSVDEPECPVGYEPIGDTCQKYDQPNVPGDAYPGVRPETLPELMGIGSDL